MPSAPDAHDTWERARNNFPIRRPGILPACLIANLSFAHGPPRGLAFSWRFARTLLDCKSGSCSGPVPNLFVLRAGHAGFTRLRQGRSRRMRGIPDRLLGYPPSGWPPIRFLYVMSALPSSASFRPRLTPAALARRMVPLITAHGGLALPIRTTCLAQKKTASRFPLTPLAYGGGAGGCVSLQARVLESLA
jgi:hypothetical protein